jgi:DNA-binding transcriptional LysR family regulator
MFPQNMRVFQEVARAGSIRKAGERQGLAPSSVSRQIAALERRMGTALFDRRAGGVELTHAGALVAQYVQSALTEFDALRSDLDDARGMERRFVRIALVESIAAYGPAAAVVKFRERHLGVSFNVRILPAPAVVAAVRGGECDIGIGFCVAPDPDLQSLSDLAEPIVLAVPNNHPLAGKRGIEVQDLVHWPLALPDQDSLTHRIVEEVAARSHIRLTPVLSSNSFDILRRFVQQGAGIAILPQRALAQGARDGAFRIVPLAAAPFRNAAINVIVLRKRRLPRVLKAFAEMLIREMV